MKDEKRFRRLVLSAIDIDQALKWARYVAENGLWDEGVNKDAKVIGRALQTAMIVAYVRPFSGNKNTKHTSVRPELPLKEKLSGDEFFLHECLQDMRHRFFAHSDAEFRDLALAESVIGGLPVSNNPYVMMSMEELNRFINLAEKVNNLISEAMIDLQGT